MDEGNIAKVSFSRKATGSVFLDVCAAPSAASWPSSSEPEPEPAIGDLPVPDFHPLLSLYPFDPPKAPAGPAARTTKPPVEPQIETAREAAPGIRARSMVDAASVDLPVLESPSEAGEPMIFPSKPVMPAFRKRVRGPSRRRRGGAKDFKRSPDFGKMWSRHGMLLSILLIILGATSYQIARTFRHFMKLEVSTLTLTPAVLLVMIMASLAGLWGVSGRRYESVALAIIAMGGIFAFLGLICKVVMIAHGRA
jgi:hypothetical protein